VQVSALVAVLAVGAGDARLMDGLREANRKGRWATPFILKQFGKNPGDAVPHLVKDLREGNASSKIAAAWALGELGVHSRDAAPALQKAQNDPLAQVRVIALMALKQIGQDQFERDNPLFVEWQRAVQKQALAMATTQARIQQTLTDDGAGKRFEYGLKNPQIQRFYNDLAQLYVYRSLMKLQGNKDIDRVLSQAGPEAIPAIVGAVNAVAALSVGFT
jgi:hypothetical protein